MCPCWWDGWFYHNDIIRTAQQHTSREYVELDYRVRFPKTLPRPKNERCRASSFKRAEPFRAESPPFTFVHISVSMSSVNKLLQTPLGAASRQPDHPFSSPGRYHQCCQHRGYCGNRLWEIMIYDCDKQVDVSTGGTPGDPLMQCNKHHTPIRRYREEPRRQK